MADMYKVESFCTIGGRNLDRNFTFKVSSSLNIIEKICELKIQKNYYLASEMNVSVEDPCFISVAINGGDKVLIFKGTVDSVTSSAQYFKISASTKIFEDSELNETFKDSSFKQGFQKLSKDIIFEAEDVTIPQIILQGSRKRSFARLFESVSNALKMPFYSHFNEDQKLVISHKLPRKNAQKIDITNALVSSSSHGFTAFAIPILQIGDIIIVRDVEYTIKGITFDFTTQSIVRVEVQ